MAHIRRKFVDVHKTQASAIAEEAIKRIAELYGVEKECQRRSKISPPGRSKTSPLDVMRYAVLGVVPVVHRRDPRCFV